MGWVVLHGCVVHVDVHGEVTLWVTTDSAWQMWSVLYAEDVECMSSAESVWHVGVSVML